MGMPDEMTPTDVLTTEELLRALRGRFEHCLFIGLCEARPGAQTHDIRWQAWGKIHTVIGLCYHMAFKLAKEADATGQEEAEGRLDA